MKWIGLLMAVVLAAPVFAGVGDDCGCKVIKKEGQGWCKPCGGGQALGVKTRSEKVYHVLAGMPLTKDKTPECAGCVKAIAENGYCKDCHAGVVDGRLYQSKFVYMVALGKPIPADKKPECDGCAAALESKGYCDDCGGGIVAHRWFKGQEQYQKAVKAHALVVHAAQAAEKCEDCGVAMLTNGECEHCHVKFEGGKKVG